MPTNVKPMSIDEAIESLTDALHAAMTAGESPAAAALTASRDGLIALNNADLAPAIASLDKQIDDLTNVSRLASRAALLAEYGDKLAAMRSALLPPPVASIPLATVKRGRPANGTGTPSEMNDGTIYIKRNTTARTADGAIVYAPPDATPCGACPVCAMTPAIGSGEALANLRQKLTQAVNSLPGGLDGLDAAQQCIAAANLSIIAAFPAAVVCTTYSAPIAA